MTEEIDHDYDYDYDYRFAEHEYKHKQEHKHEHEHEHEHENAIRHACDLSFEAGFFGALAKKNGKERRQASRVLFKNIVGFKLNQSTQTDLLYLNYKSLRSLRLCEMLSSL
jgi:ABC-type Zn2+ transport system substrate-binding protein/surface adhesin